MCHLRVTFGDDEDSGLRAARRNTLATISTGSAHQNCREYQPNEDTDEASTHTLSGYRKAD